jgi:replicative DNA helicase
VAAHPQGNVRDSKQQRQRRREVEEPPPHNRTILKRVANVQERKLIAQAAERFEALPFHAVDTAFSLNDISAQIHRLSLEKGCEVIGIDHLHLIAGEEQRKTRNDEVSAISRGLKMIFRKLDVGSIVACQLNRGGEGRAYNQLPILRDLRDSGTLEQDGDLIVLLHREDYYRYQERGYQPSNQLIAIIAKNKDGPVARIRLLFDGKHQRVSDWNGPEPAPQDDPTDMFEEVRS